MMSEVLYMTSVEINARIADLEKELAALPTGSLVLKKIKGKGGDES